MSIPHYRTVITFCAAAIIGYGGVSAWALVVSNDATIIGGVIGTWQNLAIGAFGFWVGSSSGGKAKSADTPASGKQGDPVHVTEEV